ncbi:hypothetical protein EZV62_007846 [Acer yangbiense]|uniref:CBF1-interacting co-repressor CIR N-terminal domain-containing protein n=1 Tax=Acer yangbiense TaxID=1000413 RepID=A0A5C7IBS9_9ROSI|nr:hypothetical protein EZV62_007846 [Acer yangbiense]
MLLEALKQSFGIKKAHLRLRAKQKKRQFQKRKGVRKSSIGLEKREVDLTISLADGFNIKILDGNSWFRVFWFESLCVPNGVDGFVGMAFASGAIISSSRLTIGELVMGGHGGLNILPQKRWNVYNYENREKVRQDEEAAAKEEQLKREQVRKRDAELRLEQLRVARGLAPLKQVAEPAKEPTAQPTIAEPKSNHINLFEGIRIFDPVKGLDNEGGANEDGFKRKKMKKEEVGSKNIITPDDEKYRLGYGIVGKGVKLPWYLERRALMRVV